MDLCGHATLTTAWVLVHKLGDASPVLRFATRSGKPDVRREDDLLAMDFPAKRSKPRATSDGLLGTPGTTEVKVLKTNNYLVVVDDERTIAALAPGLIRLKGLLCHGVAVTVRSRCFDFISHWFGPSVGVNEDPVTDSTHTSLVPYWAQCLGKTRLSAEQGGACKGCLKYDIRGERVAIFGKAALYMSDTLHL